MASDTMEVSATDDTGLLPVAQAISKAKRIAVLCGAGISCAAGIPDFRSSEGLFRTLRDRNPKAGLMTGKDLFTATLFQNELSTSLFYQMIAELRTMSDHAEPTAFHRFLKFLDDEGKLFRVYTQNIDGLESKAGLSCGLDALRPEQPVIGVKRKRQIEEPPPSPSPSASSELSALSDESTSVPSSRTTPPPQLPTPPSSVASTTKRGPASAAACRVIPLHGTMESISCAKCHHHEPLVGPYLASLAAGRAIACPDCSSNERARSAMSERSRGIGVMKVDVVLYGEEHVDALRIGEITQRDLMGTPRPDLLLVVGTSLKVPGTKRLVRELAKVVRSVGGQPEGELRSIYLNLEYPKPASEFRGVFDAWVRGDVQDATRVIEVHEREAAVKRAEREVELAAKRAKREANGEVVARRPAKKKGSKGEPKERKPREPRPPPPPKVKPSYETVYGPSYNVFLVEPECKSRTRNRRQAVETPVEQRCFDEQDRPPAPLGPTVNVPHSAPPSITTFFPVSRPPVSVK